MDFTLWSSLVISDGTPRMPLWPAGRVGLLVTLDEVGGHTAAYIRSMSGSALGMYRIKLAFVWSSVPLLARRLLRCQSAAVLVPFLL